MEISIEKEYLDYLNLHCSQILKYKNELEYKLQYYRNSVYRGVIEKV